MSNCKSSPIKLKEGEQICCYCRSIIAIDLLQTDGNIYSCNECLEKKNVDRCDKCHCLILQYGRKEDKYCNKCQPDIIYTCVLVEVPADQSLSFNVNVPGGNKMGISTNFFYNEIAKYMRTESRNIHIFDFERDKMICPAEAITESSKRIDFTVTSYN